MNSNSVIRACIGRLDSIVLRPGMTFSLSTYNRETGAFSEQKSISLSAGGAAALYGTLCYLRYRELCKIRRSLKKQMYRDKKVTNP